MNKYNLIVTDLNCFPELITWLENQKIQIDTIYKDIGVVSISIQDEKILDDLPDEIDFEKSCDSA